jgi:hypothetical protein
MFEYFTLAEYKSGPIRFVSGPLHNKIRNVPQWLAHLYWSEKTKSLKHEYEITTYTLAMIKLKTGGVFYEYHAGENVKNIDSGGTGMMHCDQKKYKFKLNAPLFKGIRRAKNTSR